MSREDYVKSIIQMLSTCDDGKIRLIYHFILHLCR